MPAANLIVKICCIASLDEATRAVNAGAKAIGLVSAMPSGPGVIDETIIANIADAIPPPTKTFLLTALTKADDIVRQHTRCRTTTIQLVDNLSTGELERLRMLLPDIDLVQVVHVRDEHAITQAQHAAAIVDAILLDSGNQSLAVKELGGTGRTHDWTISRRIRDMINKPLYLAGGLNTSNVTAAIHAVEPYGLDVCSGLRTNNSLDQVKVEAFFAAIALA